MQFPGFRTQLLIVLLVLPPSVYAQDKSDREVAIHRNVKLIALAASSEMPEDLAGQYRNFLPIFEQVLKQNTRDESDECALTVRVSADIKEIGSAKVRRPTARVSAFRKNSKQEYLGVLVLHSYATGGLVNNEETDQFLKKQILEPAACVKSQ